MVKTYIITPDKINDTLTSTGTDVPLSANQGRNLDVKKVEGWVTDTQCKTWKGTQSEYDAITTKDANTLYFVTDNTAGAIFNIIYPVGTLYESTSSTIPPLFIGTWTLYSSASGVYKWQRTA